MLKYSSFVELEELGWKPCTDWDEQLIEKALMSGRELAVDVQHGVTVCADNGIYVADVEQAGDYVYLEGGEEK